MIYIGDWNNFPVNFYVKPHTKPCVLAPGSEVSEQEIVRTLIQQGDAGPFNDKPVFHIKAKIRQKPIVDPAYGDYQFNHTEHFGNDTYIYRIDWVTGPGWFAFSFYMYLPYASGWNRGTIAKYIAKTGIVELDSINLPLSNRTRFIGPNDVNDYEAIYESFITGNGWGSSPGDGLSIYDGPHDELGYTNTTRFSAKDWPLGWTGMPAEPLGYWPKLLDPSIEYHLNSNANQIRLFCDCCEKIQVSDNNIANIKEVIETILEIKNGKILELLDDVKNLTDIKAWWNRIKSMSGSERLRGVGHVSSKTWLGYRYMYNTTKMDYEQARDAYLNDYMKSITDQTIKHPLRASLSDSFDNDITVRHNLKLRLKDKNFGFERLEAMSRRYGTFPSLHVIWDMIPYSFMVDWGGPIDENLSAIDTVFDLSKNYDILEALYSYKYNHKTKYAGSDIDLTVYSRSFIGVPEYEWLDPRGSVSFCLKLKRVADVASLIISRF